MVTPLFSFERSSSQGPPVSGPPVKGSMVRDPEDFRSCKFEVILNSFRDLGTCMYDQVCPHGYLLWWVLNMEPSFFNY